MFLPDAYPHRLDILHIEPEEKWALAVSVDNPKLWGTSPLISRVQSRGILMLREARLRPEYAHLYPMLEPGRWERASVVAEKVAAIRLLQLADTFVLHDRVLADAHFEFRGGSTRRDGADVRGVSTLQGNFYRLDPSP
jgi:hypothetical protein